MLGRFVPRDSSCFIAGIGKLTADDVKEKMDTVNILKLIRSEATSITAELPSKVCKNGVFLSINKTMILKT